MDWFPVSLTLPRGWTDFLCPKWRTTKSSVDFLYGERLSGWIHSAV